jgi:hypothetical protein
MAPDDGREPVTEPHPHAFPWRMMALVAVVVAVASVVAGLLLSRDRVQSIESPQATTASQGPGPGPIEDQRQVTVLLSIRDGRGKAVSNVLMGVGGGTGFVSELMLPRNLLLPTVPPVQLADVQGLIGSARAEEPLEVLLAVQVDATVELDRLAWTGLIDATGAPIDPGQAENPGSFALMVDRVLNRLPPDEQTVGQLLTGLGSMARTTVPNEDASHLLVLLGNGLRTEPVRRSVLPVAFIRGGVGGAAVMKQAAAEPVLTTLFPLARLKPGHPGVRRVVLQRAGATLGALVSSRLELAGAGFGVVADQVAAPDRPDSAVLVPDGSDASMSVGRDAAAALGLKATAVRVDVGAAPSIDVRVVLGADYRPV